MTNSNLVIIGSGPAAWAAAIYAGRAALSPIVLAGEQGGGQLMLTTEVENYPGFPEGIMGPELMAGMKQQAEKHGVMIIDKNAIKLIKTNNGFSLTYGDPISENSENSERRKVRPSDNLNIRQSGSPSFPSILESDAVIIATGATANTLKLPGEEKLMGRGVGTCAVCDAPFYRGKDVVLVIGGGDSAAEEAGELSKFVKKVVILVRKDTMRASAAMQNRIKALQNIEIWYKSEVKEFLGEKRLEKVRIVRDGKEGVLAVDGAFYAIGHTPATGWLKDSGVELDEKGYILTPLSKVISENKTELLKVDSLDILELDNLKSGNLDQGIKKSRIRDQEFQESPSSRPQVFPTATSFPGVFAAGDCVDSRYRQAITAAGYGCMAALDAQKWLETTLEK